MATKKIYTVDDEVHISELVKYNLVKSGYIVETFSNAEDMLKLVAEEKPDMIILDLMLPGIDGLTAVQKLRADTSTSKIPVIMLTAKTDELDRIIGLEIGADDYISKPFSVRELIARMKVIFRRTDSNTESNLDGELILAQDLVIDTGKHKISRGTEAFKLTLKEYELIKTLAQNKGRVMSRDILLDRVWGYDYCGETRTVDVHIRHIRIILNDETERYIETIRGVGYRFKE